MKTATMFYGSGAITSLDHAYIDKNGDIIGGSFAIGATITGEVTDDEHVVVDFSTCKKQIKAIIDDKENGIDHKLVIGPWSNCKYVVVDGRVNITTPQWEIRVPKNAVHIMDVPHSHQIYDVWEFAQGVSVLVETEMRKTYPTIDINIDCSTDLQLPQWIKREDVSTFRYTHGLKSSSSWGCQNIAHGHYSYIKINGDEDLELKFTQQRIANQLDGTMFVWKENFKGGVISYETERGEFSLKPVGNPKICVFDEETTIENLVAAVADLFKGEIDKCWVDDIVMSEGLQKGAIFTIGEMYDQSI